MDTHRQFTQFFSNDASIGLSGQEYLPFVLGTEKSELETAKCWAICHVTREYRIKDGEEKI